MADHSAIEWTDATWNFLKGCTPVGPDCLNCYAAAVAHQKQSNPVPKVAEQFAGLTELKRAGADGQRPVFNGRINVVEHLIEKPLHWKKPLRIFVNSLSDLFHEDVPVEVIDRAFAVMALCPQHTFQVLTKRPARAAEYLLDDARDAIDAQLAAHTPTGRIDRWPLPNVWIGTSAGDQLRAEERIPPLLDVPAAVRFLSLEPLLGPINLGQWFAEEAPPGFSLLSRYYGPNGFDPAGGQPEIRYRLKADPGIHWVIVGGESGPHARPMNIEWVREIVEQGRVARVPVFVKQLGAHPFLEVVRTVQPNSPGFSLKMASMELESSFQLRDRKGGDWSEWPADLRVREFPEVARA